MNRPIPRTDQYYRHFRGDVYKIVAIASFERNGKYTALVVYGKPTNKYWGIPPLIARDPESKKPVYYWIKRDVNGIGFYAELIDRELLPNEEQLIDASEQIWARPLDMFMDSVSNPEYSGERFIRVG